ncbi:MAG: HAD hydrolase-like protein [Desulfobacterales bacterium]|nr:HAD hydrolase-like protein [Desulfobacterales bacterium]
MKIENILFDLDGTLTDPKVGITRSIQYALEKLHRPVPAAGDLLWCIGPPLQESFRKLLSPDADQAETAVSLYRERFSAVGKFENEIYPGIIEALDDLSAQGFRLFVATSKPVVFALDIIAHFSLLPFFKQVYGLDGDLTDKGALISHILRNERIAAKRTLMVGDRSFDILGAKKTGVCSLGVTYGYGAKIELIEAGADFIADSPREIMETAKNLSGGYTAFHNKVPKQ